MPTVDELTAPYGNFLLGPRPGSGVCEVCFDLTGGPPRCFHCARPSPAIAAVAPISYSVAHEQLHHALAGYKRLSAPTAERFRLELAAVLWRYLSDHEACLAAASNTAGFALVTTVPSTRHARHHGGDHVHPLARIVDELVGPTRGRHRRLLEAAVTPTSSRTPHPSKFTATTRLDGQALLLVDDTWTTGANARSAAQTLHAAGAGPIAVLVIGRHLHRDYRDNASRLNALTRPYDWSSCVHHVPVRSAVSAHC